MRAATRELPDRPTTTPEAQGSWSALIVSYGEPSIVLGGCEVVDGAYTRAWGVADLVPEHWVDLIASGDAYAMAFTSHRAVKLSIDRVFDAMAQEIRNDRETITRLRGENTGMAEALRVLADAIASK